MQKVKRIFGFVTSTYQIKEADPGSATSVLPASEEVGSQQSAVDCELFGCNVNWKSIGATGGGVAIRFQTCFIRCTSVIRLA